MTEAKTANFYATQKLANTLTTKCTTSASSNHQNKNEKILSLASAISRESIQFPHATAMAPPQPDKTKGTLTASQAKRRPRRQKASGSLTAEQVTNLNAAAEHADHIGQPFNRMVTINWQQGGIDDLVAATGQFLKLMRDWLRSNNAAFAFVWVQENGTYVGRHVHLLMHVAPNLVRGVSYRQRGWLKTCGANYRKGMIKTSRIGASYAAALSEGHSRRAYLNNLVTVIDYILKDVPPDVRRQCGIKAKGNCGWVSGKRCATSQNIGKAARTKAGTSA